MITFRIDDISVNTDWDKLSKMILILKDRFPCKFIFGVSLIVSDGVGERVFPKKWNAYSDPKRFFLSDKIGFPKEIEFYKTIDDEIASHGLIHIDHRLIHREAQEMSIITSCSILGTKIFIPPFNKWNSDTQAICDGLGIQLIKFEDGWKHLKYEKFDAEANWYFHTHDFNLEVFKFFFQ